MTNSINKKSVLRSKVEELFGIDFRSLAIFRIGLAILIITYLALSVFDLEAHYTDNGVLPRDALSNNHVRLWYLSIYFISGDKLVVSLIFLLHGLFGLALLIGYYTRFSTFMSWYFLASMHLRNPEVLQNGDLTLRLLLFWSIFLPLGAEYSIDRLLKGHNNKQRKRILSWATVGIIFQVVFIYIFTAILKSGEEWWPDGTAVYYALSLDQFVTPFGLFLLKFPLLTKDLTYFVYFFEFIGPFLLFVPFYFGHIRTITIFGFSILQLGMGLSLDLGSFPWIMVVAMFPFLPTWFWDTAFKRVRFQALQNIDVTTIINKKKSKIKDSLKHRFVNVNLSKVANITSILLIVYILLWNLETVNAYKMPEKLKNIGLKLYIDQKWNMFAPRPPRDDGWYVIQGKFDDGSVVNLQNNDENISWEKPKLVSATYKTYKWRKYMMNLWDNRFSDRPFYFSRYICNKWNEKNNIDKRLKELEIFFVLEKTLPDYMQPKHEIFLLWKHNCFNKKLNGNKMPEKIV